MRDVRRTPHSYTSSEPEASNAALGNFIYVIEVRAGARGSRSYWLGYRYKAFEKYPPAGGGKWRERFKFKNAARACERPEGSYFDEPIEITDSRIHAWLHARPAGMAEIPEDLVPGLDDLLDDAANRAKLFA
jgi:hypothetical protein